MNPTLVKPGLFRDRREAGRVLAEKLAAYANRPDVVVLALPRGGVPVAYEVARRLVAIIEGDDASQFGIGIVSARIAEMILRDERAVIPIGSYNEKFGVTLSLPSIVGREGVVRTFEPEMSREERKALELSAASIRKSESRT